MSPTKQTSLDRKMFIINYKLILRAVRVMLPAAIVLAMIWPASAATVTWNGFNPLSDLWSSAGNWTGGPPLPPDSTSDVTFSSSTAITSTAVTNEINADTTINSLQYTQQSPSAPTIYHTTKIDSDVTLNITGNVSGPGSAGGVVALYAGGAAGTSTSTSQTTFTGGGNLNINASTADILVRETYNGDAVHTVVLDLSGLASFTANVDQMLVGFTTTGSQRPLGTLYLAQSNRITLNNTADSNTNAGLIVGYSSSDANSGTSYLYLGQTNVINAQNVTIGGRRQKGTMAFNTSFSNPSLVMRGADGVSRVSTIAVGDNYYESANSGTRSTGTMDLRGGTVDIMAASIIIGRTSNTAGSSGNTQSAAGSLSFDTGTIDTTAMTVGTQSVTTYHPATGTVSVSGTGNLKIGSTGLILGQFVGPGAATGTLNISGSGTVSVVSDITDGGGTSNISISGGALNMGGNSIGSTAAPIDKFTVSGGSINNLKNIAVNNLAVRNNLTLSSTGPVTIGNNGSIDLRSSAANTFSAGNMSMAGSSTLYFELSDSTSSGNDQISLNSLAFSGGTTTISISPLTSAFSSGTYSLMTFGSYTGTPSFAVNNTTRNTIPNPVINSHTGGGYELDVSGISYGAYKPDMVRGTTGTWDLKTTANWNSGGDKYYDLDSVNFGDPGAATTITLNNSSGEAGFVPGSVTVSSDHDYTFNANASTDRISGSTGLTKSGSGALKINLANDYTGTTSH